MLDCAEIQELCCSSTSTLNVKVVASIDVVVGADITKGTTTGGTAPAVGIDCSKVSLDRWPVKPTK